MRMKYIDVLSQDRVTRHTYLAYVAKEHIAIFYDHSIELWSVTHIRTGACICHSETRKDAETCAMAFEAVEGIGDVFSPDYYMMSAEVRDQARDVLIDLRQRRLC